MKTIIMSKTAYFLLLIIWISDNTLAQTQPKLKHSIETIDNLETHGVTVALVTFKGKKAVKITASEDNLDFKKEMIARIAGTNFHNGTIEVEVASQPKENSPAGSRGFAGIAFRMIDEFQTYECFYIRPTNGRADDQLRRNHSTQYISHPDYPWYRLREENPGVFESYVDLEPGVWTQLKIVVKDATAKFFVHGSSQPCLIVNDLKLGADKKGAIALWIGGGTEAYFANLKVTPED